IFPCSSDIRRRYHASFGRGNLAREATGGSAGPRLTRVLWNRSRARAIHSRQGPATSPASRRRGTRASSRAARREGMANDESKVQEFVGKALGDLGCALTASLVVIGDRLGLYRAMAGAGPLTSAELARRTDTNERCVREWLSAQAAAGYLTYDAASG